MVTGGRGHDVYPGSGPLDGGNTLRPVVVANIQSDVNNKANNSGGNDAYPNLY